MYLTNKDIETRCFYSEEKSGYNLFFLYILYRTKLHLKYKNYFSHNTTILLSGIICCISLYLLKITSLLEPLFFPYTLIKIKKLKKKKETSQIEFSFLWSKSSDTVLRSTIRFVDSLIKVGSVGFFMITSILHMLKYPYVS